MRPVAALAIATLVAAVTPVNAGPADVRVAINEYSMYFPGDYRYPELRLEIPQGGQLMFVNLDVVTGSQGWGAHTITELVPPGSIDPPRFTSIAVEPNGYAEVTGIPELARGEYAFFCETHGSAVMRGTLYIV